MSRISKLNEGILAIDPGADCGWALFRNRQLVQCGLGPFPSTALGQVSRLVIERPHTAQLHAPKKDIITLAIRAGEVGGIFSFFFKLKPEYLEPGGWKGSQSKKISHDVIRRKLSVDELKVLEGAKTVGGKRVAKADMHNVWDAVGIGLYVCQR